MTKSKETEKTEGPAAIKIPLTPQLASLVQTQLDGIAAAEGHRDLVLSAICTGAGYERGQVLDIHLGPDEPHLVITEG